MLIMAYSPLAQEAVARQLLESEEVQASQNTRCQAIQSFWRGASSIGHCSDTRS
jgi:hypothetical protein